MDLSCILHDIWYGKSGSQCKADCLPARWEFAIMVDAWTLSPTSQRKLRQKVTAIISVYTE